MCSSRVMHVHLALLDRVAAQLAGSSHAVTVEMLLQQRQARTPRFCDHATMQKLLCASIPLCLTPACLPYAALWAKGTYGRWLTHHMDYVLHNIVHADCVSEIVPSQAMGAAANLVLLVGEGVQQGHACDSHLTADHEVLQCFAILWVANLPH